mmetsp:Transcript_62117/g.146019  ORF Transcript_62117/g.146019 Transcript_62117/m.146019 type:complete len:230 (-) Transcript_62117:330-1019(-)
MRYLYLTCLFTCDTATSAHPDQKGYSSAVVLRGSALSGLHAPMLSSLPHTPTFSPIFVSHRTRKKSRAVSSLLFSTSSPPAAVANSFVVAPPLSTISREVSGSATSPSTSTFARMSPKLVSIFIPGAATTSMRLLGPFSHNRLPAAFFITNLNSRDVPGGTGASACHHGKVAAVVENTSPEPPSQFPKDGTLPSAKRVSPGCVNSFLRRNDTLQVPIRFAAETGLETWA